MKKIISLLLAVALALPTCATFAYAVEDAVPLQAAVEETAAPAEEPQEQEAAELPGLGSLIMAAFLDEEPDDGETPGEGEEPEEPEPPVYDPNYVADFYLMSNASGFPSLGHVWVYIENKSPVDLQVGCYTCPPGEGVSVGCFALTRSDGAGVYYNIEAYCGNKYPEDLKSCFHMVKPINQSELDKVSNYILRANWWDPMVVNCVFFALTCWNKAGGNYMFPWRCFPFFAKIAIKRMGEPGVNMFDPGRERVFKQRGSGSNARMELCQDGSVDTVPG